MVLNRQEQATSQYNQEHGFTNIMLYSFMHFIHKQEGSQYEILYKHLRKRTIIPIYKNKTKKRVMHIVNS
jgi:hypothetical protein